MLFVVLWYFPKKRQTGAPGDFVAMTLGPGCYREEYQEECSQVSMTKSLWVVFSDAVPSKSVKIKGLCFD